MKSSVFWTNFIFKEFVTLNLGNDLVFCILSVNQLYRYIVLYYDSPMCSYRTFIGLPYFWEYNARIIQQFN